MYELMEAIVKLLGIAGGIGLIVLVIMWFGAVPLVAMIFDPNFGVLQLILLFALMIGVIALIVKFIM